VSFFMKQSLQHVFLHAELSIIFNMYFYIQRQSERLDPKAGLDDKDKWKILTLPRLEIRPLTRQANSQ
jgi:hypothetical protein